MTVEHKTLADLLQAGYKPVPVRDRLSWAVQKRRAEKRPLFTDIYGLDRELRRALEVLMAGKGVLLTGTYGTAKTEISKQLTDLLNEYHAARPVYAVKGCPLQEDPMNLAHSAGFVKHGREACPLCRSRYLGDGKPAGLAPVERLERIVEGRGYARLQGGSDVLPEELIGSYNLVKLAQLGDPFSPEVFEPGKIGQASNGVLFVDEIGKLGEAGQYALIEASQEHQFTPAKSRERFPIDVLLIATTNPVDEDDISGAVHDRLVSIKIPIPSHKDEVAIVYKELRRTAPELYFPRPLAELAVAMVRQARASSKLDIGPRTSINSALIAVQSATLEGRPIVSYCDIKEGVYTAVLGKARHAEKTPIEGLLQKQFPKPDAFFKRYYHGIDMPKGLREIRRYGRLSAASVRKALEAKRPNITRLARAVKRAGPAPPKDALPDIIASLFDSYLHGCAKKY